MASLSAVTTVFFDVGETLFDRSREYAAWARWFGLAPHTFSAVFGAVIAQGGGVADVVGRLRPGASVEQIRRDLAAAEAAPAFEEQDLYPGVRPALAELRARGLVVGIAGNQPSRAGDELRGLDLPADHVLTSTELGVAKPDERFFAALADAAGAAPERVLYVGDQLDNDVLAPAAAGMAVVRVLTGPWGALCRDASVEARCVAVVESVADLPRLFAATTG